MPVLSMLKQIQDQLMIRYFTKNEEFEEWGGSVCPKIRKKKLVKYEDLANNCFPRGAGQQIFKVKGITGDYIVNILKRV